MWAFIRLVRASWAFGIILGSYLWQLLLRRIMPRVAPMVRRMAMSRVFALTSMISEDRMLNTATSTMIDSTTKPTAIPSESGIAAPSAKSACRKSAVSAPATCASPVPVEAHYIRGTGERGCSTRRSRRLGSPTRTPPLTH